MKSLWILNLRYLKRHRGFFFKSVVSIALLICGVFLSLSIRSAYLQHLENFYASRYGRYSGILYNADMEEVEKNREALREEGDGVVYISYPMAIEGVDLEDQPCAGYMDTEASYLKPPEPLKGKMPEAPEEIALEERTYYQLDLEAEIGDTITLPFSVDGATLKKQYVLTGILRDSASDILYQSRSYFGSGEDADPELIIWMPSAWLYEAPEEIYAVNVLCGENFSLELGGDYAPNSDAFSWRVPIETGACNKASVILIAVLLGIMALVICNMINSDIKNRRRYLVTLKCVGLSPRQAAWMFRIQALFLWAASSLLGVAAGFVSFYPLYSLGSLVGLFDGGIAPFPSWSMLFWTLLLSALSLLLSFRLKTLFIAGKRPIQIKAEKGGKAKKHRFNSNFAILWQASAGKAFRLQNVLYVLLAFIVSGVIVIGSFYSIFAPRADYASYAERRSQDDYIIGCAGGGGGESTFYVMFPLRSGITKESAQALRRETGLFEFNFIGMDHYSPPMYRKIPKGTASQYVSNNYVTEEMSDRLLSYIGEEEKSEIIEYPFMGLDEIMLDALEPYITEGSLDREKFKKGEILLAEGGGYRVGEIVSMVEPVLPEGSTIDNINGKLEIVSREVPIGAVFQLPQDALGKNVSSLMAGKLFLSADALMEKNPYTRYDYISARLKEGASQEEADVFMKRLWAKSKNCVYMNSIQKQEEYVSTQRNWMLLLYSLLGILLLVSCACMYVITSSKTKNNLHSYTLLRSVGITKKEMSFLLLYDNLRLTFLGFFIGSLLGLLFNSSLQRECYFVQGGDIYLTAVLPTFLVVLAIVVLFQVIACRRVAEGLFRQSVVEAVRDITY